MWKMMLYESYVKAMSCEKKQSKKYFWKTSVEHFWEFFAQFVV